MSRDKDTQREVESHVKEAKEESSRSFEQFPVFAAMFQRTRFTDACSCLRSYKLSVFSWMENDIFPQRRICRRFPMGRVRLYASTVERFFYGRVSGRFLTISRTFGRDLA